MGSIVVPLSPADQLKYLAARIDAAAKETRNLLALVATIAAYALLEGFAATDERVKLPAIGVGVFRGSFFIAVSAFLAVMHAVHQTYYQDLLDSIDRFRRFVGGEWSELPANRILRPSLVVFASFGSLKPLAGLSQVVNRCLVPGALAVLSVQLARSDPATGASPSTWMPVALAALVATGVSALYGLRFKLLVASREALSVEESVVVDRPAGDVFAALADPQVQMRYDGEMMRSCKKLTEGPIGKGTRFRGDFKGMGEVEYEYADFQQDHLIEHAVRLPFGAFRHRFEITSEGGGARLTQAIVLTPNILGRILWPLRLRKAMTRRLRALNASVKSYVKGG